ncbi:restriction endonuclease subunit S, partial [Escherichia coli]
MSSELVRFGDLFLEPQRNGLTRPKKVRGVGFPMVNMGELFAHSRIKNLEMDLVPINEEKEQQFFLKDGDLLFARQSLVLSGAGQCSIFLGNKTRTVFESHLIRCRLDQTRFNPDFYFYFFRSPDGRRTIEAIVEQGAGASGIRGSDLVNVQVPTPSKIYQDEAANLLVGIDDRITLLRETNATLEAIAQVLFKSWFIDFEPVRAKAEGLEPEGMDATTAALFPDSFEESELGMVPRGWIASTLDAVSDVGIGKTPPRKETQWFSESSDDMQWVSIRNMGGSGVFLTETSEYLTAEAVSRFNVRRVPRNTVMLSFKMTIGRVAITSSEMTTNEAIAHFKLTDKSPLTSEYIYLHLRNFDYSTLSSTSSIADAVNSKTVKAIPILIPSADVAAEFQRTVSVIFERIKTVQLQAQTLIELRDTLLPRLTSGQLRLPEAEVQIEAVCA